MAERSEKLEKARTHMVHVAKGLVVVLGPDDAIATLPVPWLVFSGT